MNKLYERVEKKKEKKRLFLKITTYANTLESLSRAGDPWLRTLIKKRSYAVNGTTQKPVVNNASYRYCWRIHQQLIACYANCTVRWRTPPCQWPLFVITYAIWKTSSSHCDRRHEHVIGVFFYRTNLSSKRLGSPALGDTIVFH